MKGPRNYERSAEEKAHLDRFAYIYIACEGGMIFLVICLLLIGYCIYKWRSRRGFFQYHPEDSSNCKPQLLANAPAPSTGPLEAIDTFEAIFMSETVPS